MEKKILAQVSESTVEEDGIGRCPQCVYLFEIQSTWFQNQNLKKDQFCKFIMNTPLT